MTIPRQHPFYYLFAALLLTIVIAPLIADFKILKIFFDAFLTMIFVFGCFAVSRSKYIPWIAFAISIPMLLSVWFTYFGWGFTLLTLIGNFFGILYMGLISVVILAHIFTVKKVSADIIVAALVVYLLLGVLWGYCYVVIDLLQPGSFRASADLLLQGGSGFTYYSFITLTTVGYGDITPITGIARSFSQLEGIVGQSYMAVLVARLVGMHVAEASSK